MLATIRSRILWSHRSVRGGNKSRRFLCSCILASGQELLKKLDEEKVFPSTGRIDLLAAFTSKERKTEERRRTLLHRGEIERTSTKEEKYHRTMRIMIRGGVWKNTDRSSKRVMKYGRASGKNYLYSSKVGETVRKRDG